MDYNQKDVDNFKFEVKEPKLKALAYYRRYINSMNEETIPEEFKEIFKIFKGRVISIDFEDIHPYDHVIIEKWMGDSQTDQKILNRERYYDRMGVFNSIYEYYSFYLSDKYLGSINNIDCYKRWYANPIGIGVYFDIKLHDYCLCILKDVHTDFEFISKTGRVTKIEKVEKLKIPILELRKDFHTKDHIIGGNVATVNGNIHGYFRKLRKDTEYAMYSFDTAKTFKTKLVKNVVPLFEFTDYMPESRIGVLGQVLFRTKTSDEGYDRIKEMSLEGLKEALATKFVLEYDELSFDKTTSLRVETMIGLVGDQSFIFDKYNEDGNMIDDKFKIDFSDNKYFGG